MVDGLLEFSGFSCDKTETLLIVWDPVVKMCGDQLVIATCPLISLAGTSLDINFNLVYPHFVRVREYACLALRTITDHNQHGGAHVCVVS